MFLLCFRGQMNTFLSTIMCMGMDILCKDLVPCTLCWPWDPLFLGSPQGLWDAAAGWAKVACRTSSTAWIASTERMWIGATCASVQRWGVYDVVYVWCLDKKLQVTNPNTKRQEWVHANTVCCPKSVFWWKWFACCLWSKHWLRMCYSVSLMKYSLRLINQGVENQIEL